MGFQLWLSTTLIPAGLTTSEPRVKTCGRPGRRSRIGNAKSGRKPSHTATEGSRE
jgi:hypothetical protein